MTLSAFGFMALWSPIFFVWVVLLTALYFLLIGPWRNRFANSSPVSTKQKVYFTIFMILLYVIKGSPIDLLGHLSLSIHMVQMAVLYLMMPQLLIVSIPNWLYEAIFRRKLIYWHMKFWTKPVLGLILFNGLFSLYHVPLVFDAVKTNMWLHAGVTILLFVVAFQMWWPALNTVDSWTQLSGLQRVGYIFANGVLLTPACAVITFASEFTANPHPLYATYSDPQAWLTALSLCVPMSTLKDLHLTGPEVFLFIPPLEDQQLGGILMKVLQEIFYGVLLFRFFREWYKKDQELQATVPDMLLREQEWEKR